MALILDSVTHRFGRQTALDAVTLHVERGDLYGFLGHNGAGKTTAMRIALGLMTPSAGRVLVDGFDAQRYPREARARMGGLIETPGWTGPISQWVAGTDETVEQRLNQIARQYAPIGRFASAEELAHFFVFLCSPKASYCVGSSYYVDGGWLNVVT